MLLVDQAATSNARLSGEGSDGGAFRQSLLMHRILPVILPRLNGKAPEHPGCRLYTILLVGLGKLL
ncbi:hypothetical protein [Sandarakinorhabdus sp.]|jgi:hypothetical protein|uniref:hypothetical protein n=1 Tax=Sandarakinorhabdus sp. TaxID=1916663 RepID=UPI003342C399